MSRPDPKIQVQGFPLDSELSFFRLQITDASRLDTLSLLVDRIRELLTDVSSEVKVNLAQDGGAFIMAFLADKRPMTMDTVRELAAEAMERHKNKYDFEE